MCDVENWKSRRPGSASHFSVHDADPLLRHNKRMIEIVGMISSCLRVETEEKQLNGLRLIDGERRGSKKSVCMQHAVRAEWNRGRVDVGEGAEAVGSE